MPTTSLRRFTSLFSRSNGLSTSLVASAPTERRDRRAHPLPRHPATRRGVGSDPGSRPPPAAIVPARSAHPAARRRCGSSLPPVVVPPSAPGRARCARNGRGRCQLAPCNTAVRARFNPAWASLITSRTSLTPRSTSPRRILPGQGAGAEPFPCRIERRAPSRYFAFADAGESAVDSPRPPCSRSISPAWRDHSAARATASFQTW